MGGGQVRWVEDRWDGCRTGEIGIGQVRWG